ncbi:MAG: CoA-disulfide reductase [Acidimicrobiales bacterium]|nr:MAG: CoA-disulfide reductase [Acidimicrobiales bacterium]
MTEPKKIIIVGGVAGGASVAARARRLSENAHIIVVERGSFVSYANCGLPFHISGEIEKRESLLVQTPEGLKNRFNLDVRTLSDALSIDRENKQVEIRNLVTDEVYTESYDDLVLAPGANVLQPPIPGLGRDGHFALRWIPDMDAIINWNNSVKPRHATVVGAGFIGLEMVEQLTQIGMSVTVVEAAPQVLGVLDEDMAFWVQRQLDDHGIDVRVDSKVVGFEEPSADENAAASTVVLADGSRIPSDLVILSIGVKPEVDLARDCGLDVGDLGGIRVNQHMRTSDPHIWAVGDAIEVRNPVTQDWSLIPLAGPANRQGRIAADNVMGRASRYRGTWGTSVVRVFDLTVASTGLNERQLNQAGISFDTVHAHPLSHVGYYPGAELLDMKLVFCAEDGTIYGAQVVGDESAARRLDVLATAIQGGLSVDDVAQLELCYAPAYGGPKDAVNLVAMAARNVVMNDVDIAQWHEVDHLGDDEVLIDVRSSEERSASSIPGSIHIPLDELRGRLEELDRRKRFIVHCFSGQRSYFASRMLRLHDFEVRNLTGGIRTWQSAHPDRERHKPAAEHISGLAK